MKSQPPTLNGRDGRVHANSVEFGRWMLGVGAAAVAVAVISAQQQTPPAEQPQAPQQPSEIQLVINGEPGTPPRYAVPDFVALSPDAADIAKTLGKVLWDDLNFEREFYMIPRDTYSTIPAARTAEDVPFASWRELGADAVVFGTVQKTDANTVRVQVPAETATAEQYRLRFRVLP